MPRRKKIAIVTGQGKQKAEILEDPILKCYMRHEAGNVTIA